VRTSDEDGVMTGDPWACGRSETEEIGEDLDQEPG